MTLIKNPINAYMFPPDKEINNKPSLTVPDQSMTIQEILRRFASGLPLGGQNIPIYNGEDEDSIFPINWNTMDLSEKHDYIQENADIIQKLRTEFEAEEQKRRSGFIPEPKKDTVTQLPTDITNKPNPDK